MVCVFHGVIKRQIAEMCAGNLHGAIRVFQKISELPVRGVAVIERHVDIYLTAVASPAIFSRYITAWLIGDMVVIETRQNCIVR